MLRSALLLLASSSLSFACVAQEAISYDGTWRASFESKKGVNREGKVVISGQGGTWDMAVQDRSNPCVGWPVPITVQRSTNEELVFAINRSKALTGCKDGLATLKRVDEKTLKGKFDAGVITLVKE